MPDARAATAAWLARLCVGVAVLGVCAAGSAAAQAISAPDVTGKPLDLVQLTALAERHSYGLKAGDHALLAAIAQLNEAKISPFFQFKARGGLAWVPEAKGVTGYTPDPVNQLERSFGPALSGTVEGALPLWTFGKLDAARNAAHAGVQAAELNREVTRADLRYNVRRAYFSLALALDAKQMLSEGVPKLQQALAQLEERLQRGDPDSDVTERYRMSTTLAEVQARSAEAQHLESSALSALQTLTGLRSVAIPDCPSAALSFKPRPLADYQALARANQPLLRLLDAGRRAREADFDATKARFFPDLALALSVEGQYAPGRTTYAFYTPLNLGAALVARWDLDLLGNHFRTQRAKHKLLEVEDQQSLAAEGSDLNIADKHAAVVDAFARMQAWENGHRDARRWFVSAAQNYQLGLITVRELIDGVSSYFKARFALLQAIYDLNTSVAALEQAVGAALLPQEQYAQRCDDSDPSEPAPEKPQ